MAGMEAISFEQQKHAPESGTSGVDVSIIRRSHIDRLVKAEGGVTKFADRVGTNADSISSILSSKSKRGAGHQLMRRIERAYHLAPGSLDHPDDRATAAAMVLQLLPTDARRSALDFIRYQAESSGALVTHEELAAYLTEMRACEKPRGD